MFAEGEKRLKEEIKREMHDAVIESALRSPQTSPRRGAEVVRLRGEIIRSFAKRIANRLGRDTSRFLTGLGAHHAAARYDQDRLRPADDRPPI